MIQKLEEVERKFDRLTADLSNPAVLADSAKLQKLARERSAIEKLVETFRAYKKVLADQELLESDPELKAMAKDELPALKARRAALEEELKVLLIPRDSQRREERHHRDPRRRRR